jgi:hypothetical protein
MRGLAPGQGRVLKAAGRNEVVAGSGARTRHFRTHTAPNGEVTVILVGTVSTFAYWLRNYFDGIAGRHGTVLA